MDAALWRRFPTSKHDTYSHTLCQQLWMNVPQRVEDLHLSPLIVDQSVIDQGLTGGEPLFTHRVCIEFIVGSEPKYPAWVHQVHLDYSYNLPTNLSSIFPPGTCWVFSKVPTKVPNVDPLSAGWVLFKSTLSRKDPWQTKFDTLCQDLCNIKANNYVLIQ